MAGIGSIVSNSRVYSIARYQLTALVSSLEDSLDCDDETSECVLMDEDVAGRRYLLVRMTRPTGIAHGLSPRELEIVRLVADGHPNKVIAAVLDISAWTVCTHVRRVFMKLGVSSRAAMVARMAEIIRHADGFVHPPASRTVPTPGSKDSSNSTGVPPSYGGGKHGPALAQEFTEGSGGAVRRTAKNLR
jgi:DNA-binding CsgD family transcriptional regulator